jgi:hypothetical protein
MFAATYAPVMAGPISCYLLPFVATTGGVEYG